MVLTITPIAEGEDAARAQDPPVSGMLPFRRLGAVADRTATDNPEVTLLLADKGHR